MDAIHAETGAPVRVQLQEAFGKLRENIIFKRFAVYQSDAGTVDAYIHMGGKIGVLIELEGQGAGDPGARPRDRHAHLVLEPRSS